MSTQAKFAHRRITKTNVPKGFLLSPFLLFHSFSALCLSFPLSLFLSFSPSFSLFLSHFCLSLPLYLSLSLTLSPSFFPFSLLLFKNPSQWDVIKTKTLKFVSCLNSWFSVYLKNSKEIYRCHKWAHTIIANIQRFLQVWFKPNSDRPSGPSGVFSNLALDL
jgi:hypothetical protein